MTAAIKQYIRTIPDFPKEGIQFRDITTLLSDSDGLRMTIDAMCERYRDQGIDVVAGIEARGFMFGTAIAYMLDVGFVPIRKAAKLPGAVIGRDYDLEYGTDRLEMHVDAVTRGQRVLLVDDLIATGGTAKAAIDLVSDAKAEIVEAAFVVSLPDLGGVARLKAEGHDVFWLCEFTGS